MMLGHAWTSRIDQRIAELDRLKLGLTECIGCGLSRLSAAGFPTLMTGPPPSAPVRADGSATGQQLEPPRLPGLKAGQEPL
jgi:hypothetical protein